MCKKNETKTVGGLVLTLVIPETLMANRLTAQLFVQTRSQFVMEIVFARLCCMKWCMLAVNPDFLGLVSLATTTLVMVTTLQ